jgi:hypothetical protein
MQNVGTARMAELTILGLQFKLPLTDDRPFHSTTSKMGLICLLLLLDFLELVLFRRLLSFFVFSCAINSLINDPLSTTMSHILEGDAGDRLELGVAGGVQSLSASSNTSGKSSSSEMMNELESSSP